MKSINSLSLIEQLQSEIRELIAQVLLLKSQDPGALLEQPGPGKWSVIQVLDHLNSYGNYYLPALENGLSVNKPAAVNFRPGWLGNYFTALMLPKEGEVKNKMKAPKNHSPSFHADAQPVIETFLVQQHRLLEFLEKAKGRDIGGTRVPVSLSRFIRLKLGDTFRFLIAHEQRHFVQIENTLEVLRGAASSFQAV